jgi:hypothetical protein
MLEFGQVYEIDCLLTPEELEETSKEFQNYKWLFRAGEMWIEGSKPIRTFWQKPLESSEYISTLFKTKIQTLLQREIEITRIYGNGQAHGQSAWVHTDDGKNDGGIYASLVYYLTPEWKPYYGGHLIFVDSVNNPTEVLKSIFPKSNSAVMFNSMMPHMALEPTVYCLNQRESIAVKFKVLI